MWKLQDKFNAQWFKAEALLRSKKIVYVLNLNFRKISKFSNRVGLRVHRLLYGLYGQHNNRGATVPK